MLKNQEKRSLIGISKRLKNDKDKNVISIQTYIFQQFRQEK